MATKKRVGRDSDVFLRDNDWKVLKNQLLKFSKRIDDLEVEDIRLKKVISDLEEYIRNKECPTNPECEDCPPQIECPEIVCPECPEPEDTSGFSFIL